MPQYTTAENQHYHNFWDSLGKQYISLHVRIIAITNLLKHLHLICARMMFKQQEWQHLLLRLWLVPMVSFNSIVNKVAWSHGHVELLFDYIVQAWKDWVIFVGLGVYHIESIPICFILWGTPPECLAPVAYALWWMRMDCTLLRQPCIWIPLNHMLGAVPTINVDILVSKKCVLLNIIYSQFV